MHSNHINIFLAITPSHITNFEKIIAEGNLKGNNVLLNPGKFAYRKEIWYEFIDGNVPINTNERTKLKKLFYQYNKIKRYKEFIDEVEKRFPSTISFSFYYCNLMDILTNYFFFNFRNGSVKEKIVVEDGILNYYDATFESKLNSEYYLKKLFCWIHRLSFKSFRGHITGINLNEVKKQYVRIPERSIDPVKSVELKYDPIDFEPNENVILFIGQDILVNVVGQEEYLKRVDYYFKTIVDLIDFDKNKHKLIYKPHRNGNHKIILPLSRKYFGDSFHIDFAKHQVEQIVEEIRPQKIFSFSSSGLLNIKLAVNPQRKIQFYSYPFTANNQLIDLFKRFEIKVIQ